MRASAYHALQGQRVTRRRSRRRRRRGDHPALYNQHPRHRRAVIEVEELSAGAALVAPLPSLGADMPGVLPPPTAGPRWPAAQVAAVRAWLRTGAVRLAAPDIRQVPLAVALVVVCGIAAGLLLHHPPTGNAIKSGTETVAALLPPDGRLQKALLDTLLSLGAPGMERMSSADAAPSDPTYAPGRVRFGHYRIAADDDLTGLAERFGITVDTIISFNDIRRERDLQEGLDIVVPSHSGIRYTVRRGDNLSRVAARHGVSLDATLTVNDLSSALITPGQTLLIPGAMLSENARNRVLGQLFVPPARGRISSSYGQRTDPFTGLRKFHNGIDIVNDRGTPVVASMSGTVAMVGYNGNYGRYLILRHAEGFQTLYAHLDRAQVSPGDRVRQGQQVGEMGDTGYSAGSHLHFSIFLNGTHVDPKKYMD